MNHSSRLSLRSQDENLGCRRRRRRTQHVDMTNLTFYLTLLSISAFPSRCLFAALVYLLNLSVVGSIHNGSERRKDCAAALTSHRLFKDTYCGAAETGTASEKKKIILIRKIKRVTFKTNEKATQNIMLLMKYF